MPLLHATDPLRKNDVLASNLLFATLALSVAEQLFWAAYYYWDQVVYVEPDTFGRNRVIWLLLETLLKAAFYLAIRRGMFRAKVVVLLVCAYLAYADTHLHHGYFAGVYVNDFWGYSLLVLLKDLLTLAALVLMFKKPRPALSDT
ncbi:MAG: hypothetical protein ACRYF0_04065 [Janthinobacterium lividum]